MRCNESQSLASRKRGEYYGADHPKGGPMQSTESTLRSGRGMTVLTLLLLIIALVIAAVFLVRYLRSRPVGSSPSPTSLSSPHQPFDQLNLPGVIQVVSGHSVNLLRIGPYSSG